MAEIIERIGELFESEKEPQAETPVAAQQDTAEPQLTPYADALTVPPVLRPGPAEEDGPVEVELTSTYTRLHSQLPPTPVWAYGGTFPGPTIEVPRGRRIRVSWRNRIEGTIPIDAVTVPQGDADDVNTNHPGSDGVKPDEDVAALPGWTVTHLHGAPLDGGSDGWAENAVATENAQLCEYPNAHAATHWWYHDHGMNITRWNVYAGLVGNYLVRDAEEDALRLPSGRYEVPLTLADRNLATDEDDRFTGRMLHKVASVGTDEETGKEVTVAFKGPYTTVNGTIWPYHEVEPRWYRFRVLNASNARIYQLALVDEEGVAAPAGTVWQIGSDGGLLPQPAALDFVDAPEAADRRVLPLAPAERVDLLVDFRALAGRKLRLVNVGETGFDTPDRAEEIPYPQVMEFRVGTAEVADDFVLPATLSPSFTRLTHDIEHGHRMIVLTEPGTVGGGGHPEIWEMEEITEDDDGENAEGILRLRGDDGELRVYQRVARTFDDALSIKIAHGTYEQWSFLNLGGPTHPMHIHLSNFQILSRQQYNVDGFDLALGGTTEPVTFDADTPIEVTAGEQGWKEVFQVPAGQMVNVMGQFSGGNGRFMYHCHLLEHEDMGMMRPFVVMPAEALVFDHGPDGGHDH